MAFSTSSFEKRGFRKTPIFNGLQPSKMAAALYRTQLVEKDVFNRLRITTK